jgi:hypothetical protein
MVCAYNHVEYVIALSPQVETEIELSIFIPELIRINASVIHWVTRSVVRVQHVIHSDFLITA